MVSPKPAYADGPAPPADGLLMLLAACEAIDRFEALQLTNNEVDDPTRLPPHPPPGQTSIVGKPVFRPSGIHEHAHNTLSKDLSKSVSGCNERKPNTHAFIDTPGQQQTHVSLQNSHSNAIASSDLQPPQTSGSRKRALDDASVRPAKKRVRFNDLPRNIPNGPTPPPSRSQHTLPSTNAAASAQISKTSTTPAQVSFPDLNHLWPSNHPSQQPPQLAQSQNSPGAPTSTQNGSDQLLQPVRSSTPQPPASHLNWPQPSPYNIPGAVSPSKQPAQPRDNQLPSTSAAVSQGPRSYEAIRQAMAAAERKHPSVNPFDDAVNQVAKHPPPGQRRHLTERELQRLGIQPSDENLIAALEESPESESLDFTASASNGPRKHDFFGLLAQYIELNFELATHLGSKEFVALYSISKDFHTAINGHLTHVIKRCALKRAPESARIFDWRLFMRLSRKDPVGRTVINLDGVEEVRSTPSLKWLQMVYHRERTVRDILAMMARSGIRTPNGMSNTVKKIWLTMDIATSLRRAQLMHNESFWTDNDIYLAQMFFIKVDMYCNNPVSGPGDDGTRKLMLGQRGLTPLLRLMKREILTSRLEVLQWAIRYCYHMRPQLETFSLLGIPPYEVGVGHREGWGRGRIHLYRPDELIMREAARRNLELDKELNNMMLWGYVNPVTRENIKPSDEEMYMSDEEKRSELDEWIKERRRLYNEREDTGEMEGWEVDQQGGSDDMDIPGMAIDDEDANATVDENADETDDMNELEGMDEMDDMDSDDTDDDMDDTDGTLMDTD